jgi:heme/copper-type cytochrome/quinol oxidase subunit 2
MIARAQWVVPFAVVALTLLVLPGPGVAASTTRYVTLDAGQAEFMPGRLEVNLRDRVVITLAASDVVHGFYLDGYGVDERVERGLPKTVEFVADQPGKVRYRCSVTCEPLHPFMIGELVVGPNTSFWRAAGLFGVSLAGILVYFGKAAGVRDGETQKTS